MVVEVCQFEVARVRIKLLCQTQLANRRFNLPPFVLTEHNEITGHVNLSQLRIEPFRDAKFLFGLFDQSGIIFLKHSYPDIGISKLSVSQRIFRIQINRFLEEVNRQVGLWTSSKIGTDIAEVIHGLRVIVVGFQVRGIAFGEPRLLRRAEPEPQTLSHLLRYFVLDREDVGEALIKLLGPQRRAILDSEQIHGYPQLVAHMQVRTVEHRIHLQLAGRCERVHFLVDIFAHCAGRAHRQFATLADLCDDVGSDAQTQVVLLRFLVERSERQHGQRLDLRGDCAWARLGTVTGS